MLFVHSHYYLSEGPNILLHYLHSSCCSNCKLIEKGSTYGKLNIFLVIYHTYISYGQPSHGGDRKIFEVM
jgi:hypothetical protein